MKPPNIDHLLDQLARVEAKGGPAPEEYASVLGLFDEIAELRALGTAEDDVQQFRLRTPSFATTQTMHGFVCVRPHGYPGDFEIIDRIYQRHVAAEPEYAGWDHFFHAGDAAKAVRARKSYCVNLFNSHAERSHGDVDILNVASGPCRDVLEFKAQETEAAQRTAVHCIDSDSNAIAHARQLLQRYIGDITFEERNVLRMRTTRDFDLVWSAGLFDYFDDRVFVSVLKKLYSALRTGGELVVGNFSTRLKSKSYMEFGEWRLNYRDEETIWRLARTAGFADEQISIDSEETGSNLFLHVRK